MSNNSKSALQSDSRSHYKFSSKCGWPDYQCRTPAIKRSGGGYDTYCRQHKNERAREYMKLRRSQDPSYGQGRFR